MQQNINNVIQRGDFVDYKKIFTVLSYFADAEIKLTQDDVPQKDPTHVKGPPKSKEELLAKIQNFLISEQNLSKVFEYFAQLFGNEQGWSFDSKFLKPYRFLNDYIKLQPLI